MGRLLSFDVQTHNSHLTQNICHSNSEKNRLLQRPHTFFYPMPQNTTPCTATNLCSSSFAPPSMISSWWCQMIRCAKTKPPDTIPTMPSATVFMAYQFIRFSSMRPLHNVQFVQRQFSFLSISGIALLYFLLQQSTSFFPISKELPVEAKLERMT